MSGTKRLYRDALYNQDFNKMSKYGVNPSVVDYCRVDYKVLVDDKYGMAVDYRKKYDGEFYSTFDDHNEMNKLLHDTKSDDKVNIGVFRELSSYEDAVRIARARGAVLDKSRTDKKHGSFKETYSRFLMDAGKVCDQIKTKQPAKAGDTNRAFAKFSSNIIHDSLKFGGHMSQSMGYGLTKHVYESDAYFNKESSLNSLLADSFYLGRKNARQLVPSYANTFKKYAKTDVNDTAKDLSWGLRFASLLGKKPVNSQKTTSSVAKKHDRDQQSSIEL